MVPALVSLAAGCGSDGGGGGGGATAEATASVLGLLAAVPDTEGTRGQPITYGNLARLRDGDTAGSLEDDVTLLIERSSNSVSLPRAVSNGILEPEFREFTGFDTRDIDAFIDFGSQLDQVAVIVGSVDVGDLESALRSSPSGDDLVTESIDDVTYLSLGAEGEIDFEAVSAVRRLGESIRIAVDGAVLYWSRSRAVVDACVAATANGSASLADDAAFAAVATALDQAGVVTAQMVPPWSGEAWDVAGLGETFQGETSTVTIALHYADAAAATAAVAALGTHLQTGASLAGTPWSEVLTATEIRADGQLLIATLKSLDPGITGEIYARQENLLQF